MNRGIYATASGMVAAQQWLDVTANNLANTNTTGFKSDTITFNEALQRQLVAGDDDATSVGAIGSGPTGLGQYTNMSEGGLTQTGNPLDMAITTTKGMFAVQTPDGIRYTRDGSFQASSDGTLVNAQGYAVLDAQQQPINVLGTSSQGSVGVATTPGARGRKSSSTSGGPDPSALASIGVFDGDFTKVGNNLYSGTNAVAEANPSMKGNTLEGSNVNPVEAMVDMIRLNRLVEMAQKSIQQQDDSSQKLISTMSS